MQISAPMIEFRPFAAHPSFAKAAAGRQGRTSSSCRCSMSVIRRCDAQGPTSTGLEVGPLPPTDVRCRLEETLSVLFTLSNRGATLEVMKITGLQFNPTIGDISGNTVKISEAYQRAVADGVDLVVTTELALLGYPPRDLLEREDLLAQQDIALAQLAAGAGVVPLLVGIAERNTSPTGNALYNAVAVLRDGEMLPQTARKQLLPTYDVFDERRHFEPGTSEPFVFDVNGQRIGVLLCEDIWNGIEEAGGRHRYDHDPVRALAGRADVLIVLNASPYFWGKGTLRKELVAGVAKRANAPVVYINQTGGNDELVFDGRSFAVNAKGEVIAAAPAFAETTLPVELGGAEELNSSIARKLVSPNTVYPDDKDNLEDLREALVLGIRDYVAKVGGFPGGVLLGLSGGIDSALVATLAAEALGPENVKAVSMPSGYSSQGSKDDAAELAKNLGIEMLTIPIEAAYAAFGTMLFPAIGWEAPLEVTEENVQSRIRGVTLMAISNREKRLVLGTGNKSEFAMGYATLYGDMAAGLLVIADLPKTLVYRLAKHYNREREIIPHAILTKAPSAELRPNQKDTDSLPPYDVLDPLLHDYIEERMGPDALIAKGHDKKLVAKVVRAVDGMEFKRRQAAPGLKVTAKAFGGGRRLPIAAKVRT